MEVIEQLEVTQNGVPYAQYKRDLIADSVVREQRAGAGPVAKLLRASPVARPARQIYNRVYYHRIITRAREFVVRGKGYRISVIRYQQEKRKPTRFAGDARVRHPGAISTRHATSVALARRPGKSRFLGQTPPSE